MKLVFVYNADSGKLNSLKDSFQKLVNPKEYSCSLCSVTYGLISEKKIWKDFRENSTVDMTFLHRDEFLEQYKTEKYNSITFPVIFEETHNDLKVFISSEELKEITTPEALILKIKSRLS